VGAESAGRVRSPANVVTMRQRRMISGALVLASFILAQIASADWQVATLDRESSAVAGVQHWRIVLQNSAESATIDLAFFPTNSATLRVIDNVGHCPHLSAPHASMDAIDAFLAEVVPDSAAA